MDMKDPGRTAQTELAIGARMRTRRRQLGLSQSDLAERLGVSFQQVQKYERGANRIGASRLYDLSRVLNVPVSFFFDDLPAEVEANGFSPSQGFRDEATGDANPMAKRETLELVRAYYRIPDPQLRRRLFDLAKALATTPAMRPVK